MHPFPPLVDTEGVRWTEEAKGRKSETMADHTKPDSTFFGCEEGPG
jgi:hypothetical protein